MIEEVDWGHTEEGDCPPNIPCYCSCWCTCEAPFDKSAVGVALAHQPVDYFFLRIG